MGRERETIPYAQPHDVVVQAHAKLACGFFSPCSVNRFDDCLVGEPSLDSYEDEVQDMMNSRSSDLWCNYNNNYVDHLYALVPAATEAKPTTDGGEKATTEEQPTAEEKPPVDVASASTPAAAAASPPKHSAPISLLEVPSAASADVASSAPSYAEASMRKANFREVLSKSSDGRLTSVRLFLKHSWSRMPMNLRKSLHGVENELRRSRGEPEIEEVVVEKQEEAAKAE
jgi:hypothetical protein